MASPEGSLTSGQFEIMQLLWESKDGLTVVEIWETIGMDRDVSRTTILNQVDRLEKRGWLERNKVEGVFRYRPTVDRESTESKLAADFLTEFFDGSATSLVLSLLGSKRISRNEIKRLKALLEKPEKGQS